MIYLIKSVNNYKYTDLKLTTKKRDKVYLKLLHEEPISFTFVNKVTMITTN